MRTVYRGQRAYRADIQAGLSQPSNLHMVAYGGFFSAHKDAVLLQRMCGLLSVITEVYQ